MIQLENQRPVDGSMPHLRNEGPPDYVMGHAEAEIRRLETQAQLYDWATRAVLAEAGLRAGMTVLDIGCGAGDVTMMVAELVGPEGKVIAVDKEPNVLLRARHRAQQRGYRNIDFRQGDAGELARHHAGACDAVVGRLVLVHQREPAALLTSVCRALRPGGIAAFCELESTDVILRHPPVDLYGRVLGWIFETLQRSGFSTAMGSRMHSIFAAADLDAPTLMVFTPMGGAPAWPGFALVADTLRSVMPTTIALGVATEKDIDIDTLSDRLREEISSANRIVELPPLVGAWSIRS